MAQSDARFGYEANLNREVFDLSTPFGFTCPPGQLTPIFKDIAQAGDTYYIKHDLTYLRTLPLLAPAMIDVKVHFETFFVPFQMIYQPIENTLYSLDNLQSSFYNDIDLRNMDLPLLDYEAYINFIMTSHKTDKYRANAFRLADMFGLAPTNFCEDFQPQGILSWKFHPHFFPWQILAYNTIFYYYYRLDDKSAFYNIVCNWDKFYDQQYVTTFTSRQRFMEMHYRPWDFDYFTSIYRSPIVGGINTQSVLSGGHYTPFNNVTTTPVDKNGYSEFQNNGITSFGSYVQDPPTQPNLQEGLTTASIRQMFANEKLAMIIGRTKKNYDSQVLAHIGVKVPHDVKHDLTLIGRDTYELNVGEVTSLSSSAPSGDYRGSALGDLAGKGWAQSPNDVRQHKFTCPCHGIIMTIFSVEPKRRYFGIVDKLNIMTNALDIPMPEFDRNGNVPMYRYETGTGLSEGQYLFSDIIGWKERYYPNKRAVARTSMAFMNSNAGTDIVSRNNYSSYFLTYRPYEDTIGGNGVRPDLEDRFYINPGCMNNLFGVRWYEGFKRVDYTHETEGESWDKDPYLLYARDPFIVDVYPKIKKVSWMSKDGEPIYPM